jgi:hypothetical protein
MLRFSPSFLLSMPLALVLCLPGLGQSQTSVADIARQAKNSKAPSPNKTPKVVTNETLTGQGVCKDPAPSTKEATPEDPVRTAFLRRIGGRWKLSYFRKGNQSWWPDHGTAQPKNQTHYLFGPTELLIESRPEFNPPSITARLVYGPVRKISEDMFDLALYKPCEPATEQLKRYKLSANGKTLEIATDAEGNPEPIVQVMEFVDPNGTAAADPR